MQCRVTVINDFKVSTLSSFQQDTKYVPRQKVKLFDCYDTERISGN
jgi:hypothetical protein